MTYLRPHNYARVRRNRWIAGVFIAVVVIAGALQFFSPQAFPTFANALVRPFWRVEFAVRSGAFRTPSELLAENESLKRQLDDMRMSQADSSVTLLQAQYEDLLSMFKRASTTPRQYILGAVLARPTAVPYDELILDVGRSDGVASTSHVYSAEKVLIGRVQDVLEHSTKVALYSSPGETYDVSIGPKHVTAVAVGRGGGQYDAEVPHGSGIAVGDFVSDNTLYDRAFGVVVSILNDPSSPFDTVLFAPPMNIYQLRFVLISK